VIRSLLALALSAAAGSAGACVGCSIPFDDASTSGISLPAPRTRGVHGGRTTDGSMPAPGAIHGRPAGTRRS
jgi:hypothetical protein